MDLRTNGRITWLESRAWRQSGMLAHAFSTRLGGVAHEGYHGMNFGFKSEDDRNRIIENRRLFAEHCGVQPTKVICPQLVHGKKVLAVDSSMLDNRFLDPEVEPIKADGLVTNEPDLGLFFTYADCVPLLYLDPYQKVIAAIHAGWRGVAENIASEGIRVMVESFGSEPSHIQVLIGPHAGPYDYEVDEEVIQTLASHSGAWFDLLKESRPGHAFFNMERVLRWQLTQASVDSTFIESAKLSTIERHDLFYSHRRGQTPGKMNGVMVALKS